MTITPAIQIALARFNAGIDRARADYRARPNRACGWTDFDEPCHELRDVDAYYCPTHRRARDAANAKRKSA